MLPGFKRSWANLDIGHLGQNCTLCVEHVCIPRILSVVLALRLGKISQLSKSAPNRSLVYLPGIPTRSLWELMFTLSFLVKETYPCFLHSSTVPCVCMCVCLGRERPSHPLCALLLAGEYKGLISELASDRLGQLRKG